MSYRVDVTSPTHFIPCSFVPSVAAPGMTLCVNEDGSALVVLPDGTERSTPEPPGEHWDSPWTQATALSGYLMYRSDGGPEAHPNRVPRAYRMIA